MPTDSEVLGRIEARLAALRAEVADLEAAFRVLRLRAGVGGPPGGDLAGLGVAAAAARVLAGRPGEWLHCREVADLAAGRGYRPRRRGPKSPADSFYHIMKRKVDMFESRGAYFRLRGEG